MVDHLGDLKQEIRELKRRIRVLESASPLGYSSISEGALEVRSEEGLIVIGSARIVGVLDGDGHLIWTGPWELSGLGTVTGDVAWSGDVEQTGRHVVKDGGQIVVQGAGGDVVLDSTFSSPRINLGPAQIDGNSNSFTFTIGSTTIYFMNGTIRIAGMPTKPSADYPGSFPGAVVADGLGNLFQISG